MAKTKKNIAKNKNRKKQRPVDEASTIEIEEVVVQTKADIKAAEKAQKEADKAIADKKKAKDKKEHPGWFARMGNGIKGTWAELKKVQWLSNEELMKTTGAVAAIVAVFTGATWVVDSALGALTALILGI